MNQINALVIETSHSDLSRVLQRVRLASDDLFYDVWLVGDRLIFVSTKGNVCAQAETTVRVLQNFDAGGRPHWRVDTDLFQRILVSQTTQDLKQDPIQIIIPPRDPQAAAQDVIAELRTGNLRLSWPFPAGGEVEKLAAPVSEEASRPINGPVAADAVMRCRPYAASGGQTYTANVLVRNGFACGGQAAAARWIEAEDLGGLEFAVARTDAQYVGRALRHFSTNAKMVVIGQYGWVWDESAIMRFSVRPAVTLQGPPKDVPASAKIKAGEFMSALKKVADQRKASEKFVTLRFLGGISRGKLSIATPVVGGEANATCDFEIIKGGKLDGSDIHLEMELLVEHLTPLGATPGGMITLHFPNVGILFAEQYLALEISTHVAPKANASAKYYHPLQKSAVIIKNVD